MLTSEKFNNLIGRRYILQEIQKTNLLDDCPHCKQKIQLQLDNIQDYLEDGAEMMVVTK